jgi:hypothetical protein
MYVNLKVLHLVCGMQAAGVTLKAFNQLPGPFWLSGINAAWHTLKPPTVKVRAGQDRPPSRI